MATPTKIYTDSKYLQKRKILLHSSSFSSSFSTTFPKNWKPFSTFKHSLNCKPNQHYLISSTCIPFQANFNSTFWIEQNQYKQNLLFQSFSTITQNDPKIKKITITDIQHKYQEAKPLTMVTGYDYTSASIIDRCGIDLVLVGDSLGMVMLGYSGTTSVTMDEMIHHCKAVSRGIKRSFLVGDMPFGSYEASPSIAVQNAIRLMKEGGVDAVKMEGGERIKDSVKAIINAGIPVMGHIGLTPQTCSALGGFKVQGKSAEAAQQILKDAQCLQECGVFAVVIECVPTLVSTHITSSLRIPTIGIGAGIGTSGQVLVFQDMLGMYPNFVPKFSKQYAHLGESIEKALKDYKEEVELRVFPTAKHSYMISEDEFKKAFPDAIFPLSEKPIVQTQSQSSSEAKPKQETMDSSKSTDKIGIGISDTSYKNKRNIAIIGGGSMGSLVAGRLAATGQNNVWMVSSWKEHIQKIKTTGLRLRTLDRRSAVIPVQATHDVSEILEKNGPVDLAIVLVKSPKTSPAAEKAKQLLHPRKGMVLTLQNGVGNREKIIDVIGDEHRVVQGVTSQGSFIPESGIIWHTGHGNTVLAYTSQNRHEVREIASTLTDANIPCDMINDLDSVLWGKLIINSGINPLTALLRIRNGELTKSDLLKEIMRRTVHEGSNVAKAKGVKLPFEDPLESALAVATATAENVSSMLQDVIRGETTEIDYINGAIVREGEKLGVEVLTNKTLVELLALPYIADAQKVIQTFSN